MLRRLVELLQGLPGRDRAASAAGEDQDDQMTGTSNGAAASAPMRKHFTLYSAWCDEAEP